MPKSRNKNNSSKNAPAAMPLLDSLLGQVPPTTTLNSSSSTITEPDTSRTVPSGWQCDVDDWSAARAATAGPDKFPQSLRSIERQREQAKNDFFSQPKTITKENVNRAAIVEPLTRLASEPIDLSKLSSIVTDLITGKGDPSTYADFLSILQNFSVLSARDDHLEETVYHLIQAAVSFIRSNQQQFDPSKLEECYRRRHSLKANGNQ